MCARGLAGEGGGVIRGGGKSHRAYEGPVGEEL